MHFSQTSSHFFTALPRALLWTHWGEWDVLTARPPPPPPARLPAVHNVPSACGKVYRLSLSLSQALTFDL